MRDCTIPEIVHLNVHICPCVCAAGLPAYPDKSSREKACRARCVAPFTIRPSTGILSRWAVIILQNGMAHFQDESGSVQLYDFSSQLDGSWGSQGCPFISWITVMGFIVISTHAGMKPLRIAVFEEGILDQAQQ